MTISIGSIFPSFSLPSTQGKIIYDHWIDGGWTLLITHPEDLTKFNLIKNGTLQKIIGKLERENVKILGLSELSYIKWANYVDQTKLGISFPVIPDICHHKLQYYSHIKKLEFGNATRLMILIDPFKKIRFFSSYKEHSKKHFDSILEYLDHFKFPIGEINEIDPSVNLLLKSENYLMEFQAA